MTYRLTKKAEQQRNRLTSMRRSRETARLESPAPNHPIDLPDLRRRLVIKTSATVARRLRAGTGKVFTNLKEH